MAIVTGDVLRVVFNYNLADLQTNKNIFYFEAGAGVNDSEANVINLIGTALDVAYALLNADYATDVTDSEAVFSKRNPVTGKWEQIGTDDSAQPNGTGTGAQIPNVAPAVIRFTSLGVGQQGRKFLSGFDTTSANDNTLNGSTIANLLLWFAAVNSLVAVAGGNMAPGWWSDVDTVFRLWDVAGFVNTRLGTMVRRRPGRGI